jgi:alpha-N-arabinofuranosidase
MTRPRIIVHLDEPIGLIRPALHGQFAEHLGAGIDNGVDGGIWVGETTTIPNIGGIRADVVEALRNLHVPVLRWPGGCFADDYHWRDGIGPKKLRPRTVNLWWGQSIETNAFGTHEFIQFCRLIGAEPYVAGNLGSGTPSEMREWVEYCNFAGDSTLAKRRGENGSPQRFGVKLWGVGNEQWGCGGHMTPEDYAKEYRRFATYLTDLSGTPLNLIACGPDTGRSDFHAEWTKRFFESLGSFNRIHGFGAHYYCGTAGTATRYSTDQWYELLWRAMQMEPRIEMHRKLMNESAVGKNVGLIFDEWGTWHPPTAGKHPQHLWQQNTLRDALVAAITLDIFHRHADQIVMANIAQMVNVLQAMILTEGDRMLLTPTYHVFDLYQAHQGGKSVRVTIEAEEIAFAVRDQKQKIAGLSGSASVKGGVLTVSLVNAHAALPAEVAITLRGAECGDGEARMLSGDDLTVHNTFDDPSRISPVESKFTSVGAVWNQHLPAASVTVVNLKLR